MQRNDSTSVRDADDQEAAAAVLRYEAGEDAWEESDEVVEIEVKRRLDKVIPIRLSGDKWEALRAEAAELGIGPTTLARVWILERLRLVEQGRMPSLPTLRDAARPVRKQPST